MHLCCRVRSPPALTHDNSRILYGRMCPTPRSCTLGGGGGASDTETKMNPINHPLVVGDFRAREAHEYNANNSDRICRPQIL